MFGSYYSRNGSRLNAQAFAKILACHNYYYNTIQQGNFLTSTEIALYRLYVQHTYYIIRGTTVRVRRST